MFSPYYAWSKTRDPWDHCALNVALYGPGRNHWAMTERGRKNARAQSTCFTIGASALTWSGDRLDIEVNETTSPLPAPLRGRIRLTPGALNGQSFAIDKAGAHRWRPIAAASRAEVDFSKPGLNWSGDAYLDANEGDEPLEDRFDSWNWSRTSLGEGRAAILYHAALRGGGETGLSIVTDARGEVQEFAPAPEITLPPTSVWRAPRRIRARSAEVVRTFEDTPFYSRSLVKADLFGANRLTMHESLSGERLRQPVVKAMLPFRMPRRAR